MSKSLVKLVVLFLLKGILGSSVLLGQSQRALLIGISTYIKVGETKDTRAVWRPTGIKDLACANNDLMVMENLLTQNLGFSEDHISKLQNKAATREAILNAIDAALKSCHSGDVFLFYYSGHGSTLKNPLSLEKDLLSETIVPADGIYRGSDIKDGELAVRFQQFVDKGVVLTVIVDSCHSGSISRGLGAEEKSIEAPNDDMSDPFVYPNPAANGALVFSAAQDYQKAAADTYPDGKKYSHFTKTLVDVILQATEESSAEDIYDAVMAKMRYAAIAQIPVMEGNTLRRSAGLFGKPIPLKPPAFVTLNVTQDKRVLLDAGVATGIEVGSLLRNEKLNVTVEVVEAKSVNESLCAIKTGSSTSIKPGTMFELKRRGGQGKKDHLRLYIPQYTGSREALMEQLNVFFPEEKQVGILKHKPGDIVQPATLTYSKDTWMRFNAHGDSIGLTSTTSKSEITAQALNVEIPVYGVLYESLLKIIAEEYPGVEITSYAKADYCVFGKLQSGQLGYMLVRNIPILDPTDPYAPASDAWTTQNGGEAATASKLAEIAYKLGRTKGWLTLDAPSDFHYELTVRRNNEKQFLRGGDVNNHDAVHIYLKKADAQDTTRKYVYVFGISSDGSIALIFPRNQSNVENRLPQNTSDDLIEIASSTIGAPFGNDHLVMLATSEPIINPLLIEQNGIASRGVTSSGMDDLITHMNATSRGVAPKPASGKYSIDRISLTSHE